jgi:hypothetical protein
VFLLSLACPSAGSFTRAKEFGGFRATAILHILPRHMAQRGARHKRNQIEFSVCRTSLRLPGVLTAVLNETDLYAPVKKLLEEQGYTVRAEVDRLALCRFNARRSLSASR